jgi:hypothetical protein
MYGRISPEGVIFVPVHHRAIPEQHRVTIVYIHAAYSAYPNL